MSNSETLWTTAHQIPLFMGFSRQEYWSGLLCLPPGDFSDPGIEPAFLVSPALAGGLFTTSATWESPVTVLYLKNETMILVHYQGKPLNITVIQVYAPMTNAEEAEVEWFYEDLQELL